MIVINGVNYSVVKSVSSSKPKPQAKPAKKATTIDCRYLARKDFLDRCDVRAFEQERDDRIKNRKNP